MELLNKSLQKEIKKCPSCGSVYVEDNFCESCSFQFDFDKIGAPLGERSFYSLQEDFLKNLNWAEKFLDTNNYFLKQKSTSYQRKLLFRYRDLIELLYTQKYFAHRPYFFYELGDVVQELIHFGFSEGQIFSYLDDLTEEGNSPDLLYTHISNHIKKARMLERGKLSRRLDQVSNAQILGTFKIKNLLLFVTLGLFFVSMSLSVFKIYFANR